MPQNKKASSRAHSSTGRPAARKVGGPSAKHRGTRGDAAPAPKRRWTADDRAARSRFGDAPRDGQRSDQRGGDSRPNWEPRTKESRTSRWEPRGGARPARDDRAPREDRGRFGRDDRAPREDRGGERRPFRDDRAPREDRGRFGRDDRAPRREFDRDDRAPRRNYDDRAPRRDRDERPARDDRAPRQWEERAPRRDRDERPARDDRAPRRNYEDRAPRRTDDDRAPRREFDRDRAPRPYRADRPERAGRGVREYDRAPRREFDRADRAPRRDDRADRAPRRESSYYPSREAQPFVQQDDVVLERLEAEAIQAEDVQGVSFADLGLGGNITRALTELGATSPFPIQAATIPDVLAGRHVLGRGRTGSGKTIAFGAPLVERLMENGGGTKRRPGRAPRALILAPTRELALQIDRTVQPIARSVGLFTTQIYGGVPQHRQVGALQRGVDIVIGTPGRIEDLIEQGRLDLSGVTITVLDEADHMCDLGFLEPVQRILRRTAPGGQKLLFSATLDRGVATLVDEFLENPSVHEVAGEDQASSTIDHRVLLIEQREKRDVIAQLAAGGGKTLVFARTRAFAEELADMLDDDGIPAVSLHGDLNQSRRTRNLEKLTSGKVNVLVATDVAARGIHVDDIEFVVQADAPDEYKTYLHRSGRTGRAGKHGTVITLTNRNRRRRLEELLERAEIEAEWTPVTAGDQIITDIAMGAVAR
ncbi:superfamily II DNA/RNA helicase [Diaminobutyricimonas aerilata]|uniref:Superfamily II DNA/RNA helicase n=1 Tax=Diaminobutyricimonas aerilata TaxID=1162967 RepID=A0A2M9CNL4_9MICO|nr:DEAD/DEAH box helicase [Diaminobutyricimonas aerilata]PJJ73444.1 superfamily II DNA/RNA helicase [Diaminobutyricimonas aerilata]